MSILPLSISAKKYGPSGLRKLFIQSDLSLDCFIPCWGQARNDDRGAGGHGDTLLTPAGGHRGTPLTPAGGHRGTPLL